MLKNAVLTLAGLALLGGAGSVSFADDEAVRATFNLVRDKYELRENATKLNEVIYDLAKIAPQAQDTALKYDIYILSARAHYWKGNHASGKDAKMAAHKGGMDQADAAIALNDTWADGHYFRAINLGKWALANGVIASLSRKGELIQGCETAIRLKTKEGRSGKTIDGFGPNRTLGHLYFKLPGFAGGSREKSLAYLQEALTKSDEKIALTTVYLAYTLADGDDADKARAKQILDELLASNPAAYNPSRLPETKDEFIEARELRADLGR